MAHAEELSREAHFLGEQHVLLDGEDPSGNSHVGSPQRVARGEAEYEGVLVAIIVYQVVLHEGEYFLDGAARVCLQRRAV